MNAAQYAKAIAAAAVTVGVWLAAEFGGLEVPDEVAGAVVTLLVFLVPNRAGEA